MKRTIGRSKLSLLKEKAGAFPGMLKECVLCPRRCGVNRIAGQKGFCKAGHAPVVYSYFPHRGEEPPISGSRGSGTIFFTHCTMRCVYCQNYEFSQLSDEREISVESLAEAMLELREEACHNINLVTPTHFVPQIIEALRLACENGMDLPVVYNTSGYETLETLHLLDGVVDIYLPDMRYGDNGIAEEFSSAPDYFDVCKNALVEMFRQVGNLALDENGIARKGLIIRHLVLPNGLAFTEKVFEFISRHISKEAYISLMSQYHPCYRAGDFPQIDRRITRAEYEEATGLLSEYGLLNGWVQEPPGTADSELLGTNIKKMAKVQGT